jgi:hypothetical protein
MKYSNATLSISFIFVAIALSVSLIVGATLTQAAHIPYIVTTQQFIDGVIATPQNASNRTFGMYTRFNISNNPVGPWLYSLSGAGNNGDPTPYQNQSFGLTEGDDYSTYIDPMGGIIDTCVTNSSPTYSLIGYSTGTTSALARAQSPTMATPSFVDLQSDQYVIVWTHRCDSVIATSTSSGQATSTTATSTTATSTTATSTSSGQATSTSSGEIAGTVVGADALMVTSIEPTREATVDGLFEHGWKYIFNITVPTHETHVSMKLKDWTHVGGLGTIVTGGHARISSAQASSTAFIPLTQSNMYPTETLDIIRDLSSTTPGFQIQVVVEMAIPLGTVNGAYGTEYGLRSL